MLRGNAPLIEHDRFAALAAATRRLVSRRDPTGGTLWIKVAGDATINVQ